MYCDKSGTVSHDAGPPTARDLVTRRCIRCARVPPNPANYHTSPPGRPAYSTKKCDHQGDGKSSRWRRRPTLASRQAIWRPGSQTYGPAQTDWETHRQIASAGRRQRQIRRSTMQYPYALVLKRCELSSVRCPQIWNARQHIGGVSQRRLSGSQSIRQSQAGKCQFSRDNQQASVSIVLALPYSRDRLSNNEFRLLQVHA